MWWCACTGDRVLVSRCPLTAPRHALPHRVQHRELALRGRINCIHRFTFRDALLRQLLAMFVLVRPFLPVFLNALSQDSRNVAVVHCMVRDALLLLPPPLRSILFCCLSYRTVASATAAATTLVSLGVGTVVHGEQTGKGRTAVVIAALLAWMGSAPNPVAALQLVAEKRRSSVEALTVPSHRRCESTHRATTMPSCHFTASCVPPVFPVRSSFRYVQYFTQILDGTRPRTDHLLLARVVLHGIPDFSGSTMQRYWTFCSAFTRCRSPAAEHWQVLRLILLLSHAGVATAFQRRLARTMGRRHSQGVGRASRCSSQAHCCILPSGRRERRRLP